MPLRLGGERRRLLARPEKVRLGVVYLEPDEHILATGRPLALWIPLAALELMLIVIALTLALRGQPFLARATIVATFVVVVFMVWSGVVSISRFWIVTDRHLMTRRGLFHRTQAAVLLQ